MSTRPCIELHWLSASCWLSADSPPRHERQTRSPSTSTTGPIAAASPVTDGQRLLVSFGSSGVFCFDLAGEVLWKTPVTPVQTRLSFGEACSPVLHGNSLILNRDNDGQSQLLVLDAENGEVRWK